MGLDGEDLERRRKKRAEAQRLRRKRKTRTLLLMSVALLVLIGCGITIGKLATGEKDTAASSMETTAATTAPKATEETSAETTPGRRSKNPITTIHIRAVGDLNITNSSIDAGLAANGYDFTRAFRDVAAELANADVTVMNIEGNFCGEPYGTETSSAPTELLTYLKSAGVDLVRCLFPRWQASRW